MAPLLDEDAALRAAPTGPALLVVFGGLPGTGKTTISRCVATRLGATYLRIDAIEQAIRAAAALPGGVGPAGYAVANAVAEANLLLGTTVVVDGVNPVSESRRAWREIASRAAGPLLEVEVTCSDSTEHRRRVEGRVADIEGHALPSWSAVLAHDYEPWQEPRLVIDTSVLSAQDAVTAVLEAVGKLDAGYSAA